MLTIRRLSGPPTEIVALWLLFLPAVLLGADSFCGDQCFFKSSTCAKVGAWPVSCLCSFSPKLSLLCRASAFMAGYSDILAGRAARRVQEGMLERDIRGSMNKYLRCLLTPESTGKTSLCFSPALAVDDSSQNCISSQLVEESSSHAEFAVQAYKLGKLLVDWRPPPTNYFVCVRVHAQLHPAV